MKRHASMLVLATGLALLSLGVVTAQSGTVAEVPMPTTPMMEGTVVEGPSPGIVEGAVGMVEMALEHLDEHKTVEMDDERRAAMVSNLLVVLCGEEAARPVVNAGSIY